MSDKSQTSGSDSEKSQSDKKEKKQRGRPKLTPEEYLIRREARNKKVNQQAKEKKIKNKRLRNIEDINNLISDGTVIISDGKLKYV